MNPYVYRSKPERRLVARASRLILTVALTSMATGAYVLPDLQRLLGTAAGGALAWLLVVVLGVTADRLLRRFDPWR